jgi:hypothetical protein
MRRTTTFILSFAGVMLTIGAIASASASATVWEECSEKSGSGTKYTTSSCSEESSAGKWEWLSIEETLKDTSEGGEQKLVVSSAAIKITCPKATDEGSIQPEGKGEIATWLFRECTVNIAGCSVVKTAGQSNGTIQIKELKTKLSTAGELTLEQVSPGSGVTLVVLEIGKKETGGKAEGACGILPVKDEVKGEVDARVEGETLNSEGEGTLTTDGLASELKGADVLKLQNGRAFRAGKAGPPPAPRPEQVNFLANQALLIDHRKNTAHGSSEAALAITEYGEKNEVEWESPKAGEVKKTWPAVYVLGEKVSLDTRVAVAGATREFLEKKVEGEPEITGETTVAGGALSFTKKFKLEEIKTQFTEHAGYLTTGPIKSVAGLTEKVAKSLATITWKWAVKEKGRAEATKQELGKSTHNFYLLFKKPVSETKIYFSLLDLDTLEIAKESEPLEESKVISGTWAGFTKKEKEGEAGKCGTLECPSIHIRTYNPANGEITRTGNVLWYYEPTPINLTLTQFNAQARPRCGGRSTTVLLLATLAGECGAWARALKNALATEGITSTQLRIYAKFPAGDLVCETAETCPMLVKTWTFAGGGGMSGEPKFPYLEGEVTDGNGIAGQGVENPWSFFNNHQIIEVGNKLYDPSYGTEPVGNGSAGERTTNLGLLQEKSISGFCKFNGGTGEYNCAPAEAGKPKLGSTVEAGGEVEEEEEQP